ncbi:MAG: lpxD [Verrucomicrobiales bacterium]|nr:lpxD [Verrucomicrobiales bacterium]
MLFTVTDIAKHLQGEVVGDGSVQIKGFAPADTAKAGDLTFAENEAYFSRAEASSASAILVSGKFTAQTKVLIRVANPRVATAKVLTLFYPEPTFAPGVHPSAVVASSAQVDPSAHIGPHCVVGERVRIGARSVLQAGNHIDTDAQIGEDVRLFPNVIIYSRTQIGNRVRIHAGTVIGPDGFGYVFEKGAHMKVPQIGNVIIQDDVEIGANSAIDRGALGSTIIGKGTKMDNLVHIGHNVIIGEHCVVVAQVGIAGSSRLGNYVTLAGQIGIGGHLKIGNKVTIGAQSGVMHDIPDGETWLGTPARPDMQMKRSYIGLLRLPDLLRKVRELEKRLEQVTQPADK